MSIEANKMIDTIIKQLSEDSFISIVNAEDIILFLR